MGIYNTRTCFLQGHVPISKVLWRVKAHQIIPKWHLGPGDAVALLQLDQGKSEPPPGTTPSRSLHLQPRAAPDTTAEVSFVWIQS